MRTCLLLANRSSNSVFILHRFRDITTLQCSLLLLGMKIQITNEGRFPLRVQTYGS